MFGRTLRYSNIDGPAHKLTTSTSGRIIVEDDMIMYNGMIVNASDIKESFNIESGSPSIGNVSITVYNKDNLHLLTAPVTLESSVATISFVLGDMYDEVLTSYTGIIDDVSWDHSTISFSIKSEELKIFKNVPDIILTENTFQIRNVLFDADLELSDIVTMRFALAGNDVVERNVVKYIYHPGLAAPIIRSDTTTYVEDYWKGARVDVIDAPWPFSDPESDVFCIGEFGIVVASDDNYVRLPTVLDRYVLYTFIDDNLRDSPATEPTNDIPYEIRDVINNTMVNAAKLSPPNLRNKDFASSGAITAYSDGGTGYTTVTSSGHTLVNGDRVTIEEGVLQ